MDFIVFLAGFSTGIVGGLIVAILSWLVYGILNPIGFSIFILLTVIPAQTVYCFAGVFVSKRGINGPFYKNAIQIGFIGLLSTLLYDIITNIASGIVFTNSLWPGILVGIITMNFPLPLGIIHEVSNLLLFAFLTPKIFPLVKRMIIPTNLLTEGIKN
jgi:hypothetical protein